MKSTPLWLVALGLSLIAGRSAAAPGVEGRWRTPTDDGVVEIVLCRQGPCGRLVTSIKIAREPGLADAHNADPRLRTRTLKGMVLLSGFGGGPAHWQGGKIYNPDDGRTYDAQMTLVAPDRLEVKGCVLAILCKAQTWRRIN